MGTWTINYLSLVVFLILLTLVTPHDSENFCIKKFSQTFKHPVTIIETFSKSRPCRRYGICIVTEPRPKTITKISTRIIEKRMCCDGYNDTGYNTCAPICEPACKNDGICVLPNVCKCKQNFSAPFCEPEYCEDMNKWGPNCKLNCTCSNNGICLASTGACKCEAGWMGEHCEIPCSNGTYGLYCKETCSCLNGGICDKKSGHCTCSEEWSGSRCEKRIIAYSKSCHCGKGGSCPDDNSDQCVCHPGWTGNKCDTCRENLWGENCDKSCNCTSVKSCDQNTGMCNCPIGFYGKDCQLCPGNTYGPECKHQCKCKNGAKCNHINGDCYCASGWEGEFCDKECIGNSWGENCRKNCYCSYGTCNRVTGECSCDPGYMGINCTQKCNNTSFGKNCIEKCMCVNGTCDPRTGYCECSVGYKGTTCNETICPIGHFLSGDVCTKCSCDTDDYCHPYYGCFCKGDDCSTTSKISKSPLGILMYIFVLILIIVLIIIIILLCYYIVTAVYKKLSKWYQTNF